MSLSALGRDALSFLLSAVLVLSPARCVAGGEPGPDDVEDGDAAMREVLAELDDDAAIDGLDELLREAAAFREHPIDVNAAGLAELLRVPLLDPASAVRIVTRRDAVGPVTSLDELVERGCLAAATLSAVRPYLVARTPAGAPPAAKTSEVERARPGVAWELRLRATTREGWEAAWGPRGITSGVGTFARLRVSYEDRLDLSVACEKDDGEASLADHLAFSLVWHGDVDPAPGAPEVSVGIGDFAGSWGQGLIFRSGGFPSEAGYPRRRDAVRRYDGAGETTARRGVFLTASRGAACVRAMLAKSALDAAVGDDGLVTSIRTTGYHRTAGEVAGASSLDESLGGVRVTVARPEGVEFSASAMRFRFTPGLSPGDPVRKRFAFSGEETTLGGLDVRLSADELSAGCEAALTTEGGVAVLAAARLRVGSSRLQAGGAYLSRDYWAPVGGGAPGFAGGSNGAVGWVGAEYRSGADWKVWASTRVTHRPWRSYASELPNGSSSVTVGGEARTGRDWRMSVEHRTRFRFDSEGDPSVTSGSLLRRLRATLSMEGTAPVIVTVWRVASITDDREEGSLMAVSLRVSGSITARSSCSAGLTTVSSRGNAPPLIQYEPRLPGEFGLASLNAQGTRWYIRIQAGLPAGWGLSLRLSGGPEREQTQFGLGLDVRG